MNLTQHLTIEKDPDGDYRIVYRHEKAAVRQEIVLNRQATDRLLRFLLKENGNQSSSE